MADSTVRIVLADLPEVKAEIERLRAELDEANTERQRLTEELHNATDENGIGNRDALWRQVDRAWGERWAADQRAHERILDVVRDALLMGGQTAEIRCKAALAIIDGGNGDSDDAH